MSVPPASGWSPTPPPDSNRQGPLGPNSHAQQPYSGPPSPWPSQQGYPSPDPPKGRGVNWFLGGLILVLVIGISVTTTLLLKGDETGGTGTATSTPGISSAPSDIASANDTGPVSIITVEPTCTDYYAINNVVAKAQEKGWGGERNSLGPEAQWSPEQRAHVDTATDAMSRSADQLVQLAKQTPHRVVRELYEQLIAFTRAYVAAVPNYTPEDNYLADAAINAGNTIASLCNAITRGAAPLVTGVEPVREPTAPRPPGDPASPERFITAKDPTCEQWMARQAKFGSDTADWTRYDSATPGSQWSPEERAANEAVFPIMSTYADEVEKAGRASGNPILEDFAVASAVYLRAFVGIGANYAPADSWISNVAFRFAGLIASACQAAGTK